MNRRILLLALMLQIGFVSGVFSREVPTWSVTPAGFQNSANLTAILNIDYVASTDMDDVLGAFFGDECRGVVSPVTMGENQLFFLTMYSNLNAEVLTLKAYIAALDTVIIVNESIDFIPGTEFGSPLSPVDLNAIVFFDHAPLVQNIPDQVIELGGQFNDYDLDNYLTELDGDSVSWMTSAGENVTISITASNIASVNILNTGWVGEESIVFSAIDQTDSAYVGRDSVLFTVLPLDHAPEVLTIPNQVVGTGGAFAVIDLDSHLLEEDGDSTMWSLRFGNPGSIDTIPSWSISPSSYSSTMSLTAVLRSRETEVLSENSLLAAFAGDECRGVANPVFALGKLMFFLNIYANSEGEILNFRLYDASSQLNLPVFEHLSFQTGVAVGSPELPVVMQAGYIISNINLLNQVSLTVVDPSWDGTETIRFKVQDIATPNSYSDSVYTDFTILPDHTPLVNGILDQTIETGNTFLNFDLDDFLTELDGDEVVWSISGNSALEVSIDINQIISITAADMAWTGAETIIFSASDVSVNQFTSSDTAIFTILPLDHAPVVNDIPDQLIGNGGNFSTIILNDFLTEVDGQTVQWTFTFDAPVAVDPAPTWALNAADYGSDMTLTAAITSRGRATEHGDYTLAAFVGDECRGVVNPVAMGEAWIFFLTIYANGSGELLHFRLYDGAIALDLPILENIEFQPSVSMGTPEEPYSMTAGFIEVSISSDDEVEITSLDPGWSGTENIWFTVRDLETENQYADSSLVAFSILPDHTPLVAGLIDQTIEQGAVFSSFDLDDYLTELDGDNVVWSVEGQTELAVTINLENQVAVEVLNSNWVGSENLIFRVSDVGPNAFFSRDTTLFSVIPLDHAPEISPLPSDTIGTGGSFHILDLSQYLLEQDGDQVTWSYAYAISPDPIASPAWSVTPTDYELNMTMTARILLRGEFSYASENILAAFSGAECRGLAQPIMVGEDPLYFITLYGNGDGEELEFRIYDHLRQDTVIIHQNQIFQSNAVVGSPASPEPLIAQNLDLAFISPHELQPVQANPDWSGSAGVTIFVQDQNTIHEYVDSTQVIFTVLPDASPRFQTIGNQEISEGQSFSLIALDDYLEYPEPELVTWNISGEMDLLVSILDQHQLFVTAPHENWFGSETLTLEVQQINNSVLSARQDIQYTILPVNDPPQVVSQSLTLDEDTFISVYLVATDIELDNITLSFPQLPVNGTFEDDVYTPFPDFNGNDSLKYIAFDGSLYSDTAVVHYIVNPVNDLPVFTSNPLLQIVQNETYTYQLAATDMDDDLLSYEANTLPDWLTFDGIDIVSGVPSDVNVGDHQIQVSVSDHSDEGPVIQDFIIHVGNVNDPPQFISSNQDSAFQDTPYEYRLSATDPDGDTLTYLADNYPAWMEFIAPDLLIGIPENEDVGQYHITLFVSDPQLATDTLELLLLVQNINDAPQFLSSSQDTSRQDMLFEYQLYAVDIDGDSLTYGAEDLPEWLEFIAPDVLTGIPANSDVGEVLIPLMVSDPQQGADTLNLRLLVQNVNDPPVAAAGNDQNYLSGAEIHLNGSASFDIDGDALSFEWLSFQDIQLFNEDSVIVTLNLPEVTTETELLMGLRVFDGELYSIWDTARVVVNAISEVASTDFEDNPPVSGESIILEIEFPDYYSPLSALLFYQIGGHSNVDSIVMERVTRSQVWGVEIPAESVGETGLSYYAEAIDSQGNTVTIDRRSIPISIPGNQYRMSSTMASAYPDGIPGGKWRLASIPTELNQSDLHSIFEIPLGQASGDQSWQLYEWDGRDWRTPDSIQLGRGYWFQHRQDQAVDLILGAGKSADLTRVDLELQPGWNLFSSPYNFPITSIIDSLRFSGPFTYGDFYGEGWRSAGDTLKPWEAYALYNWTDTISVLTLRPQDKSNELGKTLSRDSGWILNIGGSNGQFSDQMNQVGRLHAATAHRDVFDLIEPPVWDDYLSVSIINHDLDPQIVNYAADIRYADQNVESWTVELSVGQDVRDVELKFELHGTLPAGQVNILVDIQQRTWLELGQDHIISGLNLKADFAEHYEIFNGPTDLVYRQVQELLTALPEHNALSANYPNPFNGGTHIDFSLRNPARVRLEIFDIRGRHVRTLIDGKRNMGFYTVGWSGLNDELRLVGSGIYLYRLTIDPLDGARRYQKTRKMVIVQ